MIIIGFDCAVSNMGVCVIDYNDLWIHQIKEGTRHLKHAIRNGNESELVDVLKSIDKALSFVKILYANVVDLSHGISANKVPILDYTKSLKYLLHYYDSFIQPDTILIEYQMTKNNISSNISAQIAYHYSNIDNVHITLKDSKHIKKTSTSTKKIGGVSDNINLSFAIDDMKHNVISHRAQIQAIEHEKKHVEIIGTSLKNSFHFSENLSYGHFIEKYSNKTANKKHTDANFRKFLSIYDENLLDIIDNTPNKTDDIADAFMMIYGWILKN